jgi:hypothetical protein
MDKTLAHFIAESFSIPWLCESDQKLYWLICRYEDRVSKRLLDKKLALFKEAEKLFTEVLREEIKRPSLLFSMLGKDEGWNGAYFPVPLTLKGD